MIALDTNVIVRFLVRDDVEQAEIARRRLKLAESRRERLRITLLVLLETIWVLESAYDKSRTEILVAIQLLRQMSVIAFEADAVIEGLLHDGAKYKADLSDILIAHAAKQGGCVAGITFDKDAAKLTFFELLQA